MCFRWLPFCWGVKNLQFSTMSAGVEENHKSHAIYWWIIGGLGAGLLLIVVILAFVVCWSSSCFSRTERSHTAGSNEKISHKFQILRNTSFCCASGRYICGNSGDLQEPNGESTDQQINIPKGQNVDMHAFYWYYWRS